MAIKAEDFEYPNARDEAANERFHVFSSVVENLQDTVGVDASLDLEEADPFAHAMALLTTAIEDSPLSSDAKKFLRKAASREILESAAERIVGAYYRRLSK